MYPHEPALNNVIAIAILIMTNTIAIAEPPRSKISSVKTNMKGRRNNTNPVFTDCIPVLKAGLPASEAAAYEVMHTGGVIQARFAAYKTKK
jgi:hypothetical protein